MVIKGLPRKKQKSITLIDKIRGQVRRTVKGEGVNKESDSDGLRINNYRNTHVVNVTEVL